MGNVGLTQPAIVFCMRSPNLQPGAVTRFDRLDEAVQSVVQHASRPTAAVAWIKTGDRHLDMDEIRNLARHAGLVSYLSRTEHETSTSAREACTKPRLLMHRPGATIVTSVRGQK